MALVKKDDIAGTGWAKLPEWVKGMLPAGTKITSEPVADLDVTEYGYAAGYAAYGDVTVPLGYPRQQPLHQAEVVQELDAADQWLSEHDRGARQFTVQEILPREVTLTFTGEIVSSGDLLAGWEHITREARLDGGSVVATTDPDGHIVLYFASEDKYGD